ncbi:hypothetical protein GCM10010872_15060 [Dyella flava]|nr:hypothetical protein GCM10010872_15060 [Dyella flava]
MDESPTLDVLLKAHGWILSAATTAKLLGFPSTDALRMARTHGRLPIDMFLIEGRRGWFASSADVATWLDRTTRTVPRQRAEEKEVRKKAIVR